MTRRSISKDMSLLDKMEEIAEEQGSTTNNEDEKEDDFDGIDLKVDQEEDADEEDEEYDEDEEEYDDMDEGEGSANQADASEASFGQDALFADQITPLPPVQHVVSDGGAIPLQPLYEESSENSASQGLTLGGAGEEHLYEEGRYSPDSSFQGSLASGLSSDTGGVWSGNRRRSFQSFRSSGQSSEAELSVSSAPIRRSLGEDSQSRRQQRRVTINVPKEDAWDTEESSQSINSSRRRQNLYRSVVTSSSGVSAMTDDSASGNLLHSLRSKTPLFASRRSSGRRSTARRTSNMSHSSGSGNSTGRLGMAAAVDRLGTADQNTDWENAAAAAAVVAASASAPSNRKHVQFGQDDHVLVMLTLLNITNRVDDKAEFTIDPVNVHGYPAGEGKADDERQGPYSFILCTVMKVHFDEDERYYTVKRHDTGAEQRADPGWMEPIRDDAAVDAAFAAAKRTQQSKAETDKQSTEKRGSCYWLSETMFWPVRFFNDYLVPWYRDARAAAKVLVANILTGDNGYECRLRFTFINLFVLCSFIYLFIEVVVIAFLPASWDRAAAVMELVVWCILVLELVFEFIIRPSNYYKLISSDKAYAPSTARNVNTFHLIFESVSLLLFIPQFPCVVWEKCGVGSAFGLVEASLRAVIGVDPARAAFGRFVLGLTFLRTFGLVRHWKQMWLSSTFKSDQEPDKSFVRRLLAGKGDAVKSLKRFKLARKKSKNDAEMPDDDPSDSNLDPTNEEDQKLQMNATIGTALMLVNSHRALFLMLVIFTVFPVITTIGSRNLFTTNQVELLQSNNLAANTTADCIYLKNAVDSWLRGSTTEQTNYRVGRSRNDVFVLWAQVLPVRCDWQRSDGLIPIDGVITRCPAELIGVYPPCSLWNLTAPLTPSKATPDYFASIVGVRRGGILDLQLSETAPADFNDGLSDANFQVNVIADENHTLSFTMASLFLLLVSMLVLTLVGLSVMRGDAGRLVLHPLQRMLKIVIRYAENPLSRTASKVSKRRKNSGESREGPAAGESKEELGNYETEQLISAISKIADLLRKCWGVAGAGIISSNLARGKDGQTVIFNPTVKGQRVYALFGFIAINDFSKLLRDLENDVMILINDVARVVHDEVYRWALGDSGQCNKNLGSSFLMVFRIGDFSEVHDKKKRATDVVFNSQMKRNVKQIRQRRGSVTRGKGGKRGRKGSGPDGDTLQLASLPGIQSFTDRALLGLLKSFAGIHRDRKLQEWKKDFRFGGGVGAFTASVIYGMDAGWAVEGAVGSEYKIDATYLSPHVNMASRMMSASKQYGVTILLSQAVEELLSRPARAKLRHLDTVYVKGSSVAQRIFTYDARYEGVDFFLFERQPEQADIEAEAYTPHIWDIDQDLRSMRQHVTDEFSEKFREGVELYIEGDWKAAIDTLHEADNIMIQTVIEEGYVEYDLDGVEKEVFSRTTMNEEITRIRNDFGDGACKCLIQYMQRRNGIPPPDWHGVHPLMSK